MRGEDRQRRRRGGGGGGGGLRGGERGRMEEDESCVVDAFHFVKCGVLSVYLLILSFSLTVSLLVSLESV